MRATGRLLNHTPSIETRLASGAEGTQQLSRQARNCHLGADLSPRGYIRGMIIKQWSDADLGDV